jgi:hypothetical protein
MGPGTRGPRLALDVRVLWGADLLAVHHVAPPAALSLWGVRCSGEGVSAPPGATVTIQRAHETTSIEATRAEPTRIAPVDGVRVRIALPWVGTAGGSRTW